MIYRIHLRFILLSVFVCCTVIGCHQKQELVIISHNVLAYAGHPDSVWITNEDLLRRSADFYRSSDPDIIVLQEAPEEPNIALLAELLGYEYVYFSAGGKGSKAYPYGFPGAILSRYTIRDDNDYNQAHIDKPDTLFQRHLGSAVVETPGGPVFVLATHLCANWGGRFREPTRMAEVAYIQSNVEFCDQCALNIWAADFNFKPHSAPYDMVLNMGFKDTDTLFNDNPTVPVPEGTAKIDHIFYRGQNLEVVGFEVLRMPYYDDLRRYLSDHHAVKAVLRW
jgi:endonuclease/exonuclease/phosphatase family metal-dependent hydrolase